MGMSASQSRLLSLTSRLSALEFQAQAVSNEKIRLSTQSQQASTDYENALDLKKLTVENSSEKQVAATASRLMDYGALGTDGISSTQRILKDATGRVIVSQDVAAAYESAMKTQSTFSKSSYSSGQGTTYCKDQVYQAGLQYYLTQVNTASGYQLETGKNGNKQYIRIDDNNNTSDGVLIDTYYEPTSSTHTKAASRFTMSTNGNAAGLAQFCNTLGVTEEQIYEYGLTSLANVLAGTSGISATQAKTQIENMINGLETGEEWFLNQFQDADGNVLTECNKYRGDDICGKKAGSSYDDSAEITWYQELFRQMQECGYTPVSDAQWNDADWLYKNIQNGSIYIDEKKGTDADGNKCWEDVTLTSDSQLQEEEDSTAVAKAKAKYDQVLSQIESKDSRFDLQLKNIDTEHNAVQTEVDSVKKVIDKNIERSFKIFDA